MQEILSSVSQESLVFAAVCTGLLTYLLFARLPQAIDIMIALAAIRRNSRIGKTAMAKRLLAAMPTEESQTASINLDEVGTRLAVMEPELARLWRFHDPVLELCLQVPPLCGIALTLWGMAQDQSLTAKTALLVPTIIGVGTSIFAALMMTATRWIDLPARLPAAAYRRTLAASRTQPTKRKVITLRSHAGPVFLPVIFVAAYSDLATGLWLRERGNPEAVSLKAEIEDERGPDEPEGQTYFDVVLSAKGVATVMGVELPRDAAGLAESVRTVVRRRVTDGLPAAGRKPGGKTAALLVSMRMDGWSTCGNALRIKALVQRELVSAVREIHGHEVTVRFVEELLPS